MKMNKVDVAAKVRWEGGLQATFEYGLLGSDIADPELAAAWDAAATLYDFAADRWLPDPEGRMATVWRLLAE